MKRMRTFYLSGMTIFFGIVLLLAQPVLADFYMESLQTSKGIPGMPDDESLVKTYMTESAVRVEDQGTITIMDFDQRISYSINPQAKTYTRWSMDEGFQMPEMSGEEAKGLQEMMKAMSASVKVEPTDQYQDIEGYKCRRYDVQLMMARGAYWVSKDIKGYQKLKKLNAKMTEALQSNPFMKEINFAELMEKMDGFPVQTVMDVMGGTTTTTLKKIEEKSLDKSLFQVPEGYRLVQDQ